MILGVLSKKSEDDLVSQVKALSSELDLRTEELSAAEMKLRQAADYGNALIQQLAQQRSFRYHFDSTVNPF